MVIGIILLLVGIVGLVFSTVGFGDIGLSFGLTGFVSILCGLGFIQNARKNKNK